MQIKKRITKNENGDTNGNTINSGKWFKMKIKIHIL